MGKPQGEIVAVVDAHMLGTGEGGNETYIAGLLEGLAAVAPAHQISIAALFGPWAERRSVPLLPTLQKRVGQHGNGWRLFVEVPRACRKFHADLVHMTYNAPPWLPCPLVLTVHDVIFRRYPEYFSPRVRLLLGTLLPISMRKASVILTDSEASRSDIARFYPLARDKLVVIPCAPGRVSNVDPDYESARLLSGDRRFILAVGTVQPRKNIARLVTAFGAVRADGGADVRLLIAGQSDWQSRTIKETIRRSRFAHDIVFTGYLPDRTLAALYRTCDAFAFPSLHEGFGLPVLEAMACGAPVITSNLSSLPEVAGDAALLVDPFSTDAIAEAMRAVLNDRDLGGELRARGTRRAAEYSWNKTAALTIAAYRRAADNRYSM